MRSREDQGKYLDGSDRFDRQARLTRPMRPLGSLASAQLLARFLLETEKSTDYLGISVLYLSQ